MEAFFTMEGVLVVAVCTKKDYMAVALPEFPLSDSCWVSVDTVGTKGLVCFDLSHTEKRKPCSLFCDLKAYLY